MTPISARYTVAERFRAAAVTALADGARITADLHLLTAERIEAGDGDQHPMVQALLRGEGA